MKKLLIIFTAAFMLCSSAVMAQRVDVEGIKSKLEKADADCENPKKGAKAATWFNRGNLYFKSITEPTKDVLMNSDVALLTVACGKPKVAPIKIGEKQYKKLMYPYFTAYTINNKIVAWTVNRLIIKDAMKIAIESYQKAAELDPAMAPKVKSALKDMVKYYKQLGDCAITLNSLKVGPNAYLNAVAIQKLPECEGKPDPMMLFYAGYMLAVDGEKTPGSYVRGEGVLKQALNAGYQKVEDANKDVVEEERGNIYYYLYCCAYAQREKAPAKIGVAKKYLTEGLEKYPKNNHIFEGLLQIYTVEADQGDPKELLGTIETALKANPRNVSAWFARGRIYNALKDYDECIVSFGKVVELDPKAFDGNYYLGMFHMLRGDAELEVMKKKSYNKQADYDADLAKLNKLYIEAVPYFEAAHVAKPKNKETLDYLKQLCFRLRDEPGMMDKYKKYNELFQNL